MAALDVFLAFLLLYLDVENEIDVSLYEKNADGELLAGHSFYVELFIRWIVVDRLVMVVVSGTLLLAILSRLRVILLAYLLFLPLQVAVNFFFLCRLTHIDEQFSVLLSVHIMMSVYSWLLAVSARSFLMVEQLFTIQYREVRSGIGLVAFH